MAPEATTRASQEDHGYPDGVTTKLSDEAILQLPLRDAPKQQSQTDGPASLTSDETLRDETQTSTEPVPGMPERFSPDRPFHNPQVEGHPPAKHKHHSGELMDAFNERKQKLKDMTNPPGGFDTTPLPDAPPGYTLKFIFHRATNLPVADIASWSSDPYIHATLKAPVPKRHKEDPDLTWRTRTIRKTTEPVWDEEWIVANIPRTGFTLKCRLYDEDYHQSDDRLGNVTIKCDSVSEDWAGFPPPGREFKAKKRAGSKSAYFVRALYNRAENITPSLWVSVQVLGVSEPPHAQMYTVGPAVFFKHFSPTIGRLTGTRVNKDADDDYRDDSGGSETEKDRKQAQRYDFQSNEMQLSGPVPPEMYHRFVEFRQSIGRMFSSQGVRGRILAKALHKQHRRVYNFNRSTEHDFFTPCSEEASTQFLRLAHYDEGGRLFTYVLTLDGMFRFTETGSEFSIDMLSKHTMHSDVATYIACSGEFFIRRLRRPDSSASADDADARPDELDGSNRSSSPSPPPYHPSNYQLVIDNDSGTYRPDESILPLLRQFLEHNFPGLGVVAMHCGDDKLKKLKQRQADIKKAEGQGLRMVQMRSPSSSSLSSLSSAESDLGHMEAAAAAADANGGNGDAPAAASSQHARTKRDLAIELIEDPRRAKDFIFHPSEARKMLHNANAASTKT